MAKNRVYQPKLSVIQIIYCLLLSQYCFLLSYLDYFKLISNIMDGLITNTILRKCSKDIFTAKSKLKIQFRFITSVQGMMQFPATFPLR